MIIGIPRESKPQEYRVSMTPDGVQVLVGGGNQVLVEREAGRGAGFADSLYVKAGAQIVSSYHDVVRRSDLILKVKEPTFKEAEKLREGQILFTYLHLAANLTLARLLARKKVVALAYETVELPDHSLPLLKPMSSIAGRLSSQMGAHYLRHDKGGMGKLMGGIPGVAPARVTILGAGTVGSHAMEVAWGMGAEVVLLDLSEKKLLALKQRFPARLMTLLSAPENIVRIIPQTDLLIGAVLVTGAPAPRLVSRGLVKQMKKGSVIVDVAVDQGGCVETSRPTTHASPIYTWHGVVHYGVTNMPGCVPQSATEGLVHATLPYVREIARSGIDSACEKLPELKKGINIREGEVVHPGVQQALG